MTKNDDRITWENGVLTKAKERFPERQPVFKGADGDERPRLRSTDRGVSDPRYRDHVGYPVSTLSLRYSQRCIELVIGRCANTHNTAQGE